MDFKEIKKVFIVSAGRTGTKFLGLRLKDLDEGIFSIHEPDKIGKRKEQRAEMIKKVKRGGIFNLIILKALGITGTRNLSLKKINQKISLHKAVNKVIREREWLDYKNKSLYIEANAQFFGLVDVLNSLPNSKVVIIFRDPREWVSSWMNREGLYDNRDIILKLNSLGFKRITPNNVGVVCNDWEKYSRFERLCWVWNYVNKQFYIQLKKCNLKYFYYEDIFINKSNDVLSDFYSYILDNTYKEEYLYNLLKMMENKINKSDKNEFPKWINWNNNEAQKLYSICGDLMEKLGYGKESEWLKKLD